MNTKFRFSKSAMNQMLFACNFAEAAGDEGDSRGGTGDSGNNTDGGNAGDDVPAEGDEVDNGSDGEFHTLTNAQMKRRLERANRSLLKELGFEDLDHAKRIIADEKARRESEMSELDKAKKELKEKEKILAELNKRTVKIEMQRKLDKGARKAECIEDDDVIQVKFQAWAADNAADPDSPTADEISDFYADLKKKKPSWFKIQETGANTGTGPTKETPPPKDGGRKPKKASEMSPQEWEAHKREIGLT